MGIFDDPNYAVDGVPSAILGKITEFYNAADTYAFKGSMRVEDAYDAEETLRRARYNLERTIKTHLDRAKKGGPDA